MINEMRREVETLLNRFQLAYLRNHSTNDVISIILHLVSQHLESCIAYATCRLFFFYILALYLTVFIHTFYFKFKYILGVICFGLSGITVFII